MASSSLQIIIVSGLSGAGKSVVLNILEDLGFYTVDNVPASITGALLGFFESDPNITRVALVADSRAFAFPETVYLTLQICKDRGHTASVLFLEASTEVLMNRFSETRRLHPLQARLKLAFTEQAIERERDLSANLKNTSDIVLDTSFLNVHDLRKAIARLYDISNSDFNVNILSFGFKFGVPRDASYVFDLRFIPNPYFVESLSQLKGTSALVQDWLYSKDLFRSTLDALVKLLLIAVPGNREEGKSVLTIALGCTGGQHRSVAAAIHIRDELARLLQLPGLRLIHRDLDRT